MSKSKQPPSVGRVVVYTNWGDKDGKYPPSQIAAIVTEVRGDDRVCIVEFFRGGIFFQDDVEYTDAPAGTEEARGKWTWPAYVPPRKELLPTVAELEKILAEGGDVKIKPDGSVETR